MGRGHAHRRRGGGARRVNDVERPKASVGSLLTLSQPEIIDDNLTRNRNSEHATCHIGD